MKEPFNVSKIRHEFPMLHQKMHGKPLVYLDSAATTHKPQSVIDAIAEFYSGKYATVHRAVYDLATHATTQYSQVRQQVQHFLNAQFAEEVVFTRGTTDGINLIAATFGRSQLYPGDEVIISEMEHHSNIVPWQMICAERGAHLKIIPVGDTGELILDAYEALLTDRTKLVSIAHISNVTGTLNPIETIVARAHAKGAKVVVDGAQSAPHIPVDVQKLGCDFFVFSGHKAFGPTGIGILYGKRHLLDRLPPYQGGGDMIDTVTLSSTTYQRSPLRFEAGTPNIADVIGLGAAIQFIEELGRADIAAWEHTLLLHATTLLSKIPGLRIYGTSPNKGPIISFSIDQIHPLDLGTLLDLKGIALRTGTLCAQPLLHRFGQTSLLRASFAPYNTLAEIDLFAQALEESILLLSPSISY